VAGIRHILLSLCVGPSSPISLPTTPRTGTFFQNESVDARMTGRKRRHQTVFNRIARAGCEALLPSRGAFLHVIDRPVTSRVRSESPFIELDRSKGCVPTTLVNQHTENPAKPSEVCLQAELGQPASSGTTETLPAPERHSGDRQSPNQRSSSCLRLYR
jgi:hypothetical protein